MYTLSLTLWERVQLDLCLPRNAPLADIEQLLRIMDNIGLTNEDKACIDFDVREIDTQRGPADIRTWNDEKLSDSEYDSPIQFETEDFKVLKKNVAARQSWPTDLRTVTLKRKMDGVQEDE